MKATFTILLVSLLFCACSHERGGASGSPLDRVQPGKDLKFANYVLHIDKREGTSLEGIKIVSYEPDGQIATTTARKGTLAEGPNRFLATVVLHDALVQRAQQKWSVNELTFDLPLIGL